MSSPTQMTVSQRNALLSNPKLSHLVRPGQHKMPDGRILPPLLSANEMNNWATLDVEPPLWRILGHRPKPSEWAKKRHQKGLARRIADAMSELERDELSGDAE